MSYRKLEKAITKIKPQKPRIDQQIPAVLGLWFEDQELTEVPNRAGYLYARIRNNLSEVVQVFNDVVSPAFGLQVLLVRDAVDRSRYKIVGRDLGIYPSGWGRNDPYLPIHGSNHSFGAGDTVWVYGQQFLPFLVYPNNSVTGTVYVWPYTYQYGDRWFHAGSTGTTSLLGYKPTGSSARMVLVYSDFDGNPKLEAGATQFTSTLTGTAQVVPYLPTPPADCLYPLGAIRLLSGTNSIGWSNIYDVRPHFSVGSITGSFSIATHSHTGLGNTLLVYDNHTFKTTGTALDFTDDIQVINTGSVAYISIPTGTFSRASHSHPDDLDTILIYDDNTFKATGTAIHFNDNLSVITSGSSAWIDGQAGGSSSNLEIYNDEIIKTYSGTAIDFTHGISVVVTGSVAHVKSILEPSNGNVSQPPTETELIGILGSPSSQNQGQVWLLNDNGAGSHEYLVVDDGSHFWMSTLSKSLSATPTLSTISTGTIAHHATQWYGRASLEIIDNIWILCYKDASAHAVNDGALHIRFSNNYGEAWSDEDKYIGGASIVGFPMNPPDCGAAEDAGEPWLIKAPNGNLLLHMWRVDYGVTANGTYQSVSTNGGQSWSTGTQIDFTGIADDAKVFMTDDHFIYNNIIYAGARVYDDAIGTSVKTIFVKSEDNGTTWELISEVSDFVSSPTEEIGLEYIGNNTIVAILRDDDNTVTYKTTSTDMGATWAALSDITATFEAAGRIRIGTRSHIKNYDNWWNDKVLIANGFQLMNPGSSQSRRNAIWVSQNAGTTWTGPLYMDIEVEDAGYGDILYNPDTNEYVFISYQGTLLQADLVQYNFIISGI